MRRFLLLFSIFSTIVAAAAGQDPASAGAPQTRTYKVLVSPANQPTTADIPAAMALYGDLNHRLAPLCPAPASACIAEYAAYQSCQASATPAACGKVPACQASCTLAAADFKASFPPNLYTCSTEGLDGVTLLPDWSAEAARMQKERSARLAAHKGPIVMTETTSAAPAQQLDYMGKPQQPRCSVEDAYAHSMMVADRAAMQNGPIVIAAADAAPDTARHPPGPVRVNGGVQAGSILEKTAPVYPIMAKLAHVSGTVVLRAIISRTGEVKDLTVMSGPQMLQGAAIDAVQKWRYRPYLLNGEPTEVDTTVTVNFSYGPDPAAPPPTGP